MTYTDEQIWNEVLESTAGSFEITQDQLGDIIAAEEEKKKVAKDSSEYDYHILLLLDPQYKAVILKAVRELIAERIQEVEDGYWENEMNLDDAVHTALYNYWAENSGEYSV